MLKRLLTFLFVCAVAFSFAQEKKSHHKEFPQGKRHRSNPFLSVLDSDDFSPEDRARLKALAAKDMRAFGREMQKHFMMHRKAESLKILDLRKKILEAKNPGEKEKLTAELRTQLQKQEEKRLAFHKKILDDTERNIQMMQKRCEKLRKEYNAQTKNKNANIDKELKEVLSDNPPKRLVRCAQWDPNSPPPRLPPRKAHH